VTFAELEARLIDVEKQLARITRERDAFRHERDVFRHERDAFRHERDAFRHERDEYRKLYELASIELERLRRHIFGQKAERVDPAQMQLALDAVVQALRGLPQQAEPTSATPNPAPGNPAPPAGGNPKPKERKATQHGRQQLPEHLPVERIEIPPAEAQGEMASQLVRIGEDVSETLEWRPASFVRLQIVRPKFAVKGEPERGVFTAPAPPDCVFRTHVATDSGST